MFPASRRNPGYGQGVVTLVAEPNEEERLAQRLRETFASPTYEPPLLPVAAMELIALTRKPDVTYREILKLLESDPLITGRTLKIAESPVYARGEPLRSLEQALTRLGLSTLSDIFLQVSMSTRVFRSASFAAPMEELRRHSVATAHAARLVCRATSLPDEYAFLCGLLHDIGAAACLLALGDSGPKQAAQLTIQQVRKPIWQLHAEVGRDVCQSWKLPPEIMMIVGHHHEPRIGGHVHPLAAAVLLADQLASQAGFPSPVEPTRTGEPENYLGLPDNAVLRLRTEITRHLATAVDG